MSARLNEFDKIEWRDVSRRLRPDWTDEQFEAAWAEFVEAEFVEMKTMGPKS